MLADGWLIVGGVAVSDGTLYPTRHHTQGNQTTEPHRLTREHIDVNFLTACLEMLCKIQYHGRTRGLSRQRGHDKSTARTSRYSA